MTTNPDESAAPIPFIILPPSDGHRIAQDDFVQMGEAVKASTGMTKREEFAKAALQGILANPQHLAEFNSSVWIKDKYKFFPLYAGAIAVEHVDALIDALNAPKNPPADRAAVLP